MALVYIAFVFVLPEDRTRVLSAMDDLQHYAPIERVEALDLPESVQNALSRGVASQCFSVEFRASYWDVVLRAAETARTDFQYGASLAEVGTKILASRGRMNWDPLTYRRISDLTSGAWAQREVSLREEFRSNWIQDVFLRDLSHFLPQDFTLPDRTLHPAWTVDAWIKSKVVILVAGRSIPVGTRAQISKMDSRRGVTLVIYEDPPPEHPLFCVTIDFDAWEPCEPPEPRRTLWELLTDDT